MWKKSQKFLSSSSTVFLLYSIPFVGHRVSRKMIVKEDHVSGSVQWELAPTCKCGAMRRAFDSKFLFATRFSDKEAGRTMLYMMPMDAYGDEALKDGIVIAFCPSCGDRVTAKRKSGT
jgi:hypothetical protein